MSIRSLELWKTIDEQLLRLLWQFIFIKKEKTSAPSGSMTLYKVIHQSQFLQVFAPAESQLKDHNSRWQSDYVENLYFLKSVCIHLSAIARPIVPDVNTICLHPTRKTCTPESQCLSNRPADQDHVFVFQRSHLSHFERYYTVLLNPWQSRQIMRLEP